MSEVHVSDGQNQGPGIDIADTRLHSFWIIIIIRNMPLGHNYTQTKRESEQLGVLYKKITACKQND